MGTQSSNQRIRLLLNADLPAAQVTDIISGLSPVAIMNGADLQIELCISDGVLNDTNIIDFTNITSVVVALQNSSDPHNAQAYWSFTIPNSSINNTLTTAQWTGAQPNTQAQITLPIPNANNSINLTAGSSPYWLCIYGITNDATPKQVPYGFFQVVVLDTGMPVVNPNLPSPFKVGSTLNFLCSDGLTRTASIQQVGQTWTLVPSQAGTNSPGQASYAFFCSDNLYRDLSIVNVGGIWTLQPGQTGHS